MSDSGQLGLEFTEKRSPFNVLPHDGEAIYHGPIFDRAEANESLDGLLQNIAWKHHEVVMFGKQITTARQVAWYGDAGLNYSYSGRTRTALEWTDGLRDLKSRVEERSGGSFNSCLLNLYADGDQGMGWHSDDEKELGPQPCIASVSFGAVRRFDFRHKQSREKVSVILDHGSLLVMKGLAQSYWQHQIPKSKKVTDCRVNLTFRTITPDP